ncbi:MAG: SpoIID/LytB domain-containing protein [Myxococcota bacterium]|nr:SpoIID/LytB domain-containing protein [Myxococcota bacterium]
MFQTFLALSITLVPSISFALDMTRKARRAALYANQIVFDRRGEPLVSVRITERQSSVRFESGPMLSLMPGGDEGSQIRTTRNSEWTVTVEAGQRGQSRYWVAVERIPAANLSLISQKRIFWKNAGHTVKFFEAGALIGIDGQTLDTRTITIGVSPQTTRQAALSAAEALSEKTSLKRTVIDEPVKRPTGWIIAREKRTGIEIRSRDLLWTTQPDTATLTFPNMEYGHGTPKQGRATRRYAGDVYFAIDRVGQLAVVNVLSAERLLEGVVPSELYPAAPMEALKAQAVAARGQLLAKIGTRHRSDPYLLCAETHCQVYSGATRRAKRTNRAVQATRGQLLFEGKRLVDTTYSSACGGHSEAAHLIWGGEARASTGGQFDNAQAQTASLQPADIRSFLDHPPPAYCSKTGNKAGVFRWRVKRRGAYVTKRVNARADIGPVIAIKPLKRGRSGRALAIEYVGKKGRHTVRGEYTNRKLLGNLRSGLFLVSRQGGLAAGEPQQWIFQGGGFGHGVGLCQHGAMGMALEGHTFDRILKHYYRGSGLRKAW